MPFSTVVIARNEAKTLPRLVKSLGDFQKRGGEIVVVDTGSKDDTVQIARNLGCTVFEEGGRFLEYIDPETAAAINQEFTVANEPPVVRAGDQMFNYTAARNYAASVARNDIISMPDCDEIWTKLDLDAVERSIVDGVKRFEYNFVFSHDQFGEELVKFLHSKFYDRRAFKWVGIVHEVLTGEGKTHRFGEDVMKLEHWQNETTNRSGYLKGLALDCYRNPTNDRNSHYFARELMWSGRPQSAISEFKRHIAMNKWPAEAAQSMIFIGDCQMNLGLEDMALAWYHKSYAKDGGRREALIRLATHYWKKNDHQRAAAFAAASLTIPWNGYYGNNSAEYAQIPHEILYWALWYLGDHEGSKQHWQKCIEYQPKNPKYIADAQFYEPADADKEMSPVTIIIPQWGREDGLKRCIDSIDYDNSEVLIDDGPETVPVKVNRMAANAKNDLIIFAANDMEFTPGAIAQAIKDSKEHALVAFDAGNSEECEHFLIRKDLIAKLGHIFDERFHHVGCDNLLMAQAKKMGEFARSSAKVEHHHFSRGAQMDATYLKGWSKVEEDRALLKQELAAL